MRRFSLAIFIITIGLLTACEKNDLHVTDFADASGNAQVKVNIFSFYRSNPAWQIKINDQRVSNAMTAATPFPGGGLNTGGGSTADYLGIAPGNVKFSVSLPKAGTSQDSVAVAESSFAVSAGTKYSVYFADTAAKTTAVLVVDSLNAPDSGFAKFKFINLIPDLPSADLYIGTTKVASGVAYKAVSPSFTVPTNNASTTWAIRAAGGTTNLATYASASTLGNQRVYTVVARGYSTLSASSDPRARRVSLIYNR